MSVHLTRSRRARASAVAAADQQASVLERALAALTAVTILLTGAYMVLL